MFQENNICLSYNIITIGEFEMKRGDWGFTGRESWVKKKVEECKIFTIARLHKEMRNRGGKPQNVGEI